MRYPLVLCELILVRFYECLGAFQSDCQAMRSLEISGLMADRLRNILRDLRGIHSRKRLRATSKPSRNRLGTLQMISRRT